MKCQRCGKYNPAEIHTCSPNQKHDEALLRQALEALEIAEKHMAYVEFTEAIAALKERLK